MNSIEDILNDDLHVEVRTHPFAFTLTSEPHNGSDNLSFKPSNQFMMGWDDLDESLQAVSNALLAKDLLRAAMQKLDRYIELKVEHDEFFRGTKQMRAIFEKYQAELAQKRAELPKSAA